MFKYIIMHFKSEIEYKASFILTSIGQVLALFLSYITVFTLIERFNVIKNFNVYQIMIGFGVVQFGQSFSEGLLRGFDQFSDLIKNGRFDILLIRPQNIILQIFGTKIEFSKFPRALFSILCVIYAVIKLKLYAHFYNIIVILLMLIGSTAIFSSLLISTATICFKTIEGLEFINIFIYGTRDFAQYPISIYNKFVKIFFTAIIPMALNSYFPLLYITNNSDNVFYLFLPLISILTIIPACLVFNYGVKLYKSSGS